MEKIIKWGVIGSGGIARRRTISEGIIPATHARLTSVFDIDQDVNKDVAKEFDAAQTRSIEELLTSDIDAVYIASPVYKHLEHITLCAKSKKHVLCEKTFGLTIAEAEKIVRVSKEAVYSLQLVI